MPVVLRKSACKPLAVFEAGGVARERINPVSRVVDASGIAIERLKPMAVLLRRWYSSSARTPLAVLLLPVILLSSA